MKSLYLCHACFVSVQEDRSDPVTIKTSINAKSWADLITAHSEQEAKGRFYDLLPNEMKGLGDLKLWVSYVPPKAILAWSQAILPTEETL